MKEGLLTQLTNYKQITIKLLTALEVDEFDLLEALFFQRQKIIEVINSLDYEKDDFYDICEDLGIKVLEDQLRSVLIIKRIGIKNKIKKIHEHRNARKSYTNKFSVDSIFFNKKI